MSTRESRLLRAPQAGDTKALFPQIYKTRVTDGIAWDGPDSEHDYASRWGIIVDEVRRGERHFFVITEPESRAPIGSCDVRPDTQRFRATLGIWVGEAHQHRGLGTQAIAELVDYSFTKLGLHKLDAEIFVGNWASRRAFEKNGFELEGTAREALLKRGIPRDEWHFGLVNRESRFAGGVAPAGNDAR
jgi:[ribosomal protein S5]-alanine N-acetyltransferase